MPGDETSTDAELIERANGGDREALAALYLRHRDWCVSVAFRFTRQRDDALDIVQDVFAALFRRFPPWAPRFELRAKLTTYLYPAIRNTAATRARRAGVAADERFEPAADGRDGGEEANAALRRAVEALPEGQREVLLMRVVDGMSVGEIALALDVPEGTVKSRLHHALGTLSERAELRRYFPGR